jgi:hypothetical protein
LDQSGLKPVASDIAQLVFKVLIDLVGNRIQAVFGAARLAAQP